MLSPLRTLRLAWGLVFLSLIAACDDPSERALRHHDRGLSLKESGAPEKAALEFRNALRLDEGFVAARFELAKLLEQAGDFNGALANLRAIVEVDPAHAPARVRLANAMLMANEPERALENAEIAVRAAPQLPDALIARSMAAYRLGDTAFALQDAKQALLLEPGNPEAGLIMAIERYDSGALEDAHTLLDQFIERRPQAFALHLTKLKYLTDAKDDQAVGTQLSRMTKLFPDNTQLRRLKVDWHVADGDLSAAELELRQIQRLLPQDPAPIMARIGLIARIKGNSAARSALVHEIAQSDAPDFLQLQLALFDQQAGDQGAAITQLNNVIAETEEPEVAIEARLSLARIQGSAKDFDAVDATTSEVLIKDPGNANALALRSAAHLRRDAVEDALFDIQSALTEQPENVELLALAAEIYQRNGSPVLAGESLATAVRESGYAWETVLAYASHLIRLGDERGYRSLIEDAYRKHPTQQEPLTALIRLRLGERDWAEASRLNAELLRLDVSASKRIAAEIALHREQYDMALSFIDELADGPGDVSVVVAKVQTHVRSGDMQRAREVIDEALHASPASTTYLNLDALWHELERNPEQAENSYRKTVSSAPQDVSGYVSLASFLDRTGRVEDARIVIADGIQRANRTAVLRLQLASISMRSGDAETALEQFERIYAEHPDSMLAANNLASALVDYAGTDEANIARAEKIARRLAGTSNPAFKDTYGWTRVLAGDLDGGAPYLLEAAKELPQNPWIQYHAGMALHKLGRAADARPLLEAALSISQNAPFPPREKILQVIQKMPL